MSAISLKSITGITSITTPTGVDNQLTLHNNNTTEAVKLDVAGNLHFHNHLNITGVSTAANFKTGTSNLHNTGLNVFDLDVDGHTNLDNVSIAGVTTGTTINATTFSGALSGNATSATTTERVTLTNQSGDSSCNVLFAQSATGNQLPHTNANLTFNATNGRLTATSFVGALPISNDTNNRVITATGSGGLNGEANLTFDGSTLSVGGNISMGDSNRIYIGGSNDAYIYHDTANTHFVNGTGHLQIRQTANSDVITQTNGIDRVRIYNDGLVAIGQSSKSSTAGAGNLDIQGNATSCIIEMGNPFPTFSGGVVPEFRITATNSSHTVDFESVWGGDNLLHKHLALAGGATIFYRGDTGGEVARFSSDKFGVGTNSPGQLIHTHSGASSGGLAIQSNGSTNYIAAIQTANNFINGSTAGGLAIRSGNGIEFSGNDGSTVQMRLASGNLTIGDGNLVVASGHGIDFSAEGNASGMTSELFDDYEEGSWLPAFYPLSSAMTHTYDLRTGSYVKIGRVVYWQFRMRLSGLSGQMGQTMGFGGFPYNVDSGQPQFSANLYGSGYNGESPTGIFYEGNVNRGTLYYHKNDGQNVLYANDLNPTNSYTVGSGFYFAA